LFQVASGGCLWNPALLNDKRVVGDSLCVFTAPLHRTFNMGDSSHAE
jgi:hypothetical protein